MKRCPTCQSTYTDDSLSFCLSDGATLTDAASFDARATLRNENQATLREDDNVTLRYQSSPRNDPTQAAIFKANTPQGSWNPPQPPPAWVPSAPQPVASLSQRASTPWIIGGAAILLLGVIITVIVILTSRNSYDVNLRSTDPNNSGGPVANANSNKSVQDDRANQNANQAVAETDAPPTDPDLVLSQLTALEYEWNDANIKGNKAAIRRLLADEFRGVGADGSVENKEQMLENTRPTPQIASLTLSDLKISLAGNTAVLTGLNTAKAKTGQSVKFRFTDTFLWRDGRWQAISSQSSQVK